MAANDKRDPYRDYKFLVEIDGAARGGFHECSGLDASAGPVEYREGSEARTVRKLPGLAKSGTISLKRGITGDAGLWQWRKRTIEGQIQHKNGSIIVRDETGREKVRWNFLKGVPTKWTGPSLNATAGEVAIESLDISHEGLEMA
jgi:phage tail-like protein